MTNALPPGLTDCLLWSDELGMGWHGRPPMSYTGPYFAKYQQLDATAMGAALTQARLALLRRHFAGQVVDIGIGGGRFVTEAGAMGFDVNAEAVAWLKQQDRYYDPYQHHAEAVTGWDSREQIPEPEKLLAHVGEWLFVSMPIYESQAHCLGSKHYKPGEHIWYWTLPGLIDWMERQGFALVEMNQAESELGREGITSFVGRRHD